MGAEPEFKHCQWCKVQHKRKSRFCSTLCAQRAYKETHKEQVLVNTRNYRKRVAAKTGRKIKSPAGMRNDDANLWADLYERGILD